MSEKESPINPAEEPQALQQKPDVWSAEKYLKRTAMRKNEDTSEETLERVEEAIARLGKPLAEVKYQETGEVEVNANDAQFKFSYSLLDEENKRWIDNFTGGKMARNVDKEDFIKNADNWRSLDNLIFQVEGKEKNVLNSLPKNSSVFFCPSMEYAHGAAVDIYFADKYHIYIVGDITTPRSLVTLMHEIGHVFDYENHRKKGSPIKGSYHHQTAEKIRRERAASAFALKMMRPFFKNKQFKEDAITFLKNYSLADYNWDAIETFRKEEEQRPYREREAVKAQSEWEAEEAEMETYRLIDDFYEWKKTDAYKEWKEKEENKNLDEYDEFGVWRQWIEDTNYDYQKDLKKEDKKEN